MISNLKSTSKPPYNFSGQIQKPQTQRFSELYHFPTTRFCNCTTQQAKTIENTAFHRHHLIVSVRDNQDLCSSSLMKDGKSHLTRHYKNTIPALNISYCRMKGELPKEACGRDENVTELSPKPSLPFLIEERVPSCSVLSLMAQAHLQWDLSVIS